MSTDNNMDRDPDGPGPELPEKPAGPNLRERYRRIGRSKEFVRAYHGMTSDTMEVEDP